MRVPPHTVSAVHFIGIGGIGMSGIAEVLCNLGYKVTGSDITNNYNIERLKKIGAEIYIGHEADNVKNSQVVVISSAVKNDNPEIQAAINLKIPIIHRSEMLAELMRFKLVVGIAGTHGKTTTTSLAAALLETANLDPTVINGGIINAYNTNARLGSGDWAVVEADESDGSFTKLPITIGIVTNIDPEHMEHYQTETNLYEAFSQYLSNLPFYGLGILCVDHPVVKKLAAQTTHRRIITYGFDESANIRAINLRPDNNGITFDVEINLNNYKISNCVDHEKVTALPNRMKDIFLPMMGKHNVQNSLAVIGVAKELGIDDYTIRKTLTNFKGVKRRFTVVGNVNGVKIVDDYAHHPTEIQAVIQAAKLANPKSKVIAVVQPHRYTRLRDLFNNFAECFAGSDGVVLVPLYPAGEDPIPGINSANLAIAIRKTGLPVYEVQNQNELACKISTLAGNGDTVLLMGAGSITNWAAALPLLLSNLSTDDITSNGRDPSYQAVI